MNGNNVSDYEEVVKAVQKYAEGTATGNTDLLGNAFDPNATMFSVDAEKLTGGPIRVLFDTVAQLGGDEATKYRIDVLALDGTAAVARVVMEGWHGMSFTDFHTLLKINGEWKIIGKIYQSH